MHFVVDGLRGIQAEPVGASSRDHATRLCIKVDGHKSPCYYMIELLKKIEPSGRSVI